MKQFFWSLMLIITTPVMASVQWILAGQLVQGNTLKTSDGEVVAVVSVNSKYGTSQMYNLTVNYNHDFFVSSYGGSLLVHNCVCPECGYIPKRKNVLKEHMRIHTNERPYECPVTGCGAKFRRSDALLKHKRGVHEKILSYEKKFVCRINGCGKKFVYKSRYEDHQNTHYDIKNFSCPHCDYKAKTSNALYMHKRRYHAKDPSNRAISISETAPQELPELQPDKTPNFNNTDSSQWIDLLPDPLA